jgi:putative tryptophan/tyrosine transport system substrate-binding protein
MLLGGAVTWPLPARAQQTGIPVIGFMGSESPEPYADRLGAFRRGLQETGFVEGQNVAVEYRWAQGQYDRYPELAAGGEPSPQSAKAATKTIPIVFTANGDPVKQGLVTSLNRPGGNVTGVTVFGDVAVAKRLQLMHELVPQAAAIAYLMNPSNLNSDTELAAAREAARARGIEILIHRALMNMRSIRRLQPWLNNKRRRSSVAPTHSSISNATSSSRSQPAIGSQ